MKLLVKPVNFSCIGQLQLYRVRFDLSKKNGIYQKKAILQLVKLRTLVVTVVKQGKLRPNTSQAFVEMTLYTKFKVEWTGNAS